MISIDAKMRVLFAVPQGPAAPGPRYRVLQYLPHYEAAGLDCDVIPMVGTRATARSLEAARLSVSGRLSHLALTFLHAQRFILKVLREAGRTDRVYLYRVPVGRVLRERLARVRERVIFDFDDAIDAAEDASALSRFRQRFWSASLRNAVSASSLVVASNSRNAEAVRRLGGRAVVVPTSVLLSAYTFRDRRASVGARPVIGWMGTPSTASYLRLIEAPLERLVQCEPVLLRVIGAGGNPFERLSADARDWSLQDESAEIADFDIGLMPMPDTPWTRGKAALKALQYGASGAPTVASWTETNAEILGDGVGALLCRTSTEWFESLRRLAADGEARAELGLRARAVVQEKYSVERNADILIGIIRNPAEFGP